MMRRTATICFCSIWSISATEGLNSCNRPPLLPFVSCQRRPTTAIPLFRDLISNNEEDLRVHISVIKQQDGLDQFLKTDDRKCVIKLYAPFCKACKAFGAKFRRLALQRGDRMNAAGDIIRPGIARFGEIEYSGNIKLCQHLKVTRFPTVLIYRGGEECQCIGEIDCKNISIENLVSQMDDVIETHDH